MRITWSFFPNLEFSLCDGPSQPQRVATVGDFFGNKTGHSGGIDRVNQNTGNFSFEACNRRSQGFKNQREKVENHWLKVDHVKETLCFQRCFHSAFKM